MSDFYKRFLMEDVPRVTPGTNKQIFLGAFGKHPGWDDHIEDLGLETASLTEAKKLFYVQGIGGEIDAGAWEKLEDSQRLAAFKHVFVWQRPGQYLIGRLWSSSDGKGRTRYPMVVCAHCNGVSLSWALDQVLPRLEQIEQSCAITSFANDVRAILNRHRTDLRNIASGQTTELNPPSLDTAFMTKFAAHPELGPKQEGWMRLLYGVQNQFGAFARGRFNPKSVASTIRPQQIRVPRAADSVPKAILQWSAFFLTQIDPQTPMLLTAPLEEQWVDVTVGEPASQELFSLRASPKAMPLINEVPYNLSDDFRAQARQVLAVLETGRPPASILTEPGTPLTPVGQPAPRGKFLKWFGGGAALVAVAAAVIALLPQRKPGERVAEEPPQTGILTTEVVAAARPSSASTPPPAPSPSDSVVAQRAANEQRLAEEKQAAERQAAEKQAAEEKAKLAAAARLKANAEEQEKVRLAAEAEAARKAVEATAAARKAEEQRLAQEKASAAAQVTELARLNPEAKKAPEPKVATKASNPSPAWREHTNGIGMVFVWMPAGYWVGKYEVTQAEYEKIAGRNPSRFDRNPRWPVESVNWEDAIGFCRELTSREKAARRLEEGWVYSLPQEKQWQEFVGDAQLQTSVTSYERPGKRVSPEAVGSTGQPNRLGLFDVRGNVWEWCLSTNDSKVVRGGAFDTIKGFATSVQPVDYWKLSAEQRRPQVGFRCVLVKPP